MNNIFGTDTAKLYVACLPQKNHTSKVLPYHNYAEHKLNHTGAFAKRKQKIEENTQAYK
jgi:hypothetical protein